MAAERRVLLAIHDVAPPFTEECLALWALCRAQGIRPALLVVPEWHGCWPLADDRALVRWLRCCQDDGAELMLHGHRHDEVGSTRSLRGSLRAVGRTAREGEFLSLSYDAAQARIARRLEVLHGLALTPIGFVPPAWLMSSDTHRAAASCGLPISEDAEGVLSLATGGRVAAPAVRWSTRTRLRAALSPMVAQSRREWHGQCDVVRLALHPRDLHDAAVARSVRDAVRWRSTDRTPVSYRHTITAAQ